jgi:hypothetical protein
MSSIAKKLLLIAAACVSIAPLARADDGFDADSVNAWLDANGYAQKSAEAETAARRRKLIAPDTAQPELADALVASRVAMLQQWDPKFDSYPTYLQDALLSSSVHGEIYPRSPMDAAVHQGEWSAAADAYHASFERSETYYAAKDALEFTDDKSSPAAKELQATMAKTESGALPRADVERMQFTELAYRRAAREQEVERTWARAILSGQQGAVFEPAVARIEPPTPTQIAAIDVNDQDSRQQRASVGVTTSQFSLPTASSGGLGDIQVQHGRFVFNLADRNIVDGDIVTLRFVDRSGTVTKRTVALTGPGQVISVNVPRGSSEILLTANNNGSLGTNGGRIRISSDVTAGRNTQTFNISTGQTAVLRITGR